MNGLRDGQNRAEGSAKARNRSDEMPRQGRHSGAVGPGGWPLDKSLCAIPQLFSASLAYGCNLLDHSHTIDPWRIRNQVPWVRTNPPVGQEYDNFRRAWSMFTVACKSKTRWFDAEAVRQPASPNTNRRTAQGVESRPNTTKTPPDSNRDTLDIVGETRTTSPMLDWWNIPTKGYPGAHYATWTPEVARRAILAMCPREVCTLCGEPRRRITEPTPEGADERVTTGWSVCDCPAPDYRRGVVFDPFAGSGTTLAVATGLGRDAIGVDLDPGSEELARERVGMFLTTTVHTDGDDEERCDG